jgi:hypothetical protein
MKHAGPDTLQALAPLLARLRALPGLVERTPGCFYKGSKAFLHFHADPSGVHADVRLSPGGVFTRLRVQDEAEGDALMAAASAALAGRVDGRGEPRPPSAAEIAEEA